MAIQITFFRALTKARVSTDDAEKLVSELALYVRGKVSDATAGIERQLRVQNVLVFFLSVMATTATAIGGYLAMIRPGG